jgi:hypothetical protein
MVLLENEKSAVVGEPAAPPRAVVLVVDGYAAAPFVPAHSEMSSLASFLVRYCGSCLPNFSCNSVWS